MERLKAMIPRLATQTTWMPILFCVAGLVMAHHPMMKDGLGWISFDPGDTRFCNYLLEHSYRWMIGAPGHEDLWSPPYFFPVKGTLAWAENMLGAMPFYAVWRGLGFRVDTAFQLWIFSLGALNFVATYFFLRRCLKVDTFAASVGATLFAFAGMRVNQTMHYQLFPHFFTVWAVHAAWRLMVDELEEAARVKWLVAFFASVAAQIAVGIYLGWFLVFGLGVAFLAALPFKVQRERLWFVIRSHPFTILLCSALSAAALLPIATKYLATAREFGGRPLSEALSMVPLPQSWLHFGPYSWVYAGLAKLEVFRVIPMEHEQRIGFGFVTILLVLPGLWIARKERTTRFLAGLLVFFILVTTLYGGYPDGFTPWKFIYSYFPGAKAIRGVSRVALLYLLGVSIFVSLLLHHLRQKKGLAALAAIPLGLLCLAEQGETAPAFNKFDMRRDVQAIVDAVEPDCTAFLATPMGATLPYTWKYHLDAMMAQLELNKPTINGYSGQNPPGWGLYDSAVRGGYDEPRIGQAAQQWISQNQLQGKICWAKHYLQEGNFRADFLSQEVPSTLQAGAKAQVVMRYRNPGPEKWPLGENFKLGTLQPQDNTTWGLNRVELPKATGAGEEVEFRFEITAPTTPGDYVLQLRPLKEMQGWFGAPSTPVKLSVTP